MFDSILPLLLQSLSETLYMVTLSSVLAMLFGLPIGLILAYGNHPEMLECPRTRQVIEWMSNALRSIPFIILIIALIPLTRLIVGSAIGTSAAVVPLTIGAIPFFARLVQNVCLEIPPGLVEAGIAMGAKPTETIRYIILPEAIPGLINAFTVTVITLVGYSAMAGAVGAGGLGDLAIRYGYQRFNMNVTYTTVLILIALVQLIQFVGSYFSKKYTH